MKLLLLLTPLVMTAALAGCGSGVHDALDNEAETMYRVPAYPSTAERRSSDEEAVYVRPAYRPVEYQAVPADCDELIYGGDGYYYCNSD